MSYYRMYNSKIQIIDNTNYTGVKKCWSFNFFETPVLNLNYLFTKFHLVMKLNKTAT